MSAGSKACRQPLVAKDVSSSVLVKKEDKMSMTSSLLVLKKIKSQFTVEYKIMWLFYVKK